MTTDTWREVALPALEEIANQERQDNRPGNAGVAKAIEVERGQLDREVASLIQSRYADGIDVSSGASAIPEYINLHLLERGKRAVGEWPSDDPYDDLVQLLKQRISEAEDANTRNKLQRFLEALLDTGKGVVTGVISEMLRRQMGM